VLGVVGSYKEKESINDRIISHGICDKCGYKVKGLTINWTRQKIGIRICGNGTTKAQHSF
jgi:hypothetical protein